MPFYRRLLLPEKHNRDTFLFIFIVGFVVCLLACLLACLSGIRWHHLTLTGLEISMWISLPLSAVIKGIYHHAWLLTPFEEEYVRGIVYDAKGWRKRSLPVSLGPGKQCGYIPEFFFLSVSDFEL